MDPKKQNTNTPVTSTPGAGSSVNTSPAPSVPAPRSMTSTTPPVTSVKSTKNVSDTASTNTPIAMTPESDLETVSATPVAPSDKKDQVADLASASTVSSTATEPITAPNLDTSTTTLAGDVSVAAPSAASGVSTDMPSTPGAAMAASVQTPVIKTKPVVAAPVETPSAAKATEPLVVGPTISKDSTVLPAAETPNTDSSTGGTSSDPSNTM